MHPGDVVSKAEVWPGTPPMEAAIEIDVTFLIADLAGFTALTETHGSLHAAHVVTRFVELVRATLPPGTRLVERVGDAVLIVAEATTPAMRAAVALRDAAEREPRFPLLRIGVHGGRSCNSVAAISAQRSDGASAGRLRQSS